MKRFMVVIGVLVTFGFLMVITESCGNSEQTLGPTGQQEQSILTNSKGDNREALEESFLLIVIPGTGEKRELHDPWISGAILSILPEETRIRLFVEGSVLIEDTEIASMIVAGAGMESFDVSGGVLLASLSCIKACYSDKPPCSPCPACCDDKPKPEGVVRYIDY